MAEIRLNRRERFANWLERWWVLRVLEKMAHFAILITLVAIFLATPERQADRIRSAWQVVTAARNQHVEGGRVEALGFLNENGENLSGLVADSQLLVQVNLSQAMLQGASLDSATLRCAELAGANLWRANLRHADLSFANLSHAILAGANMSKANFYGARLDSADLDSVNLDSASFDSANLVNAQRAGYDIASARHGAYSEIIIGARAGSHSRTAPDSSRTGVPKLADSSYTLDIAFADRFLARRRAAALRVSRFWFWKAWFQSTGIHSGNRADASKCFRRIPNAPDAEVARSPRSFPDAGRSTVKNARAPRPHDR